MSKKQLAITTAICLLPILAGAALYPQLPEQIATHFGFSGEPDGWSSKALAVFGLPGLMAALNLLVYAGLNSDPKAKNMSSGLRTISIWVIPVLSAVCTAMTLGNALGYQMRIEMVLPALVGVLFILVGNYLPNTKQSYTMGVKLPWTLNSEENWNRTHRLAGFLWVLGGVAFLAVTFLKLWNIWVFGIILAMMVLVPVFYSYGLYRKGI